MILALKYQIEKSSLLEQQVLIDRILSWLAKEDYVIESATESVIAFKNNFWQIRSKGTGLRKVDKGKFKLIANEGIAIKYTYYISFLPELSIVCILLVIGFFQSFLILFM